MQKEIDVREGFEPSAELRLRAAYTLRDSPDDAVVTSQERDNTVGFAQLVLAQHDCVVPVQPHVLQCPTSRG